ncbi:unnamed protein product [Ambrosiozyma monospora]|uniref:Unnamed protein product n=1 Tax=Ambrosiozyma monospora TaxID=43982 RepID=A0ACB5T3W7_AMBMO|nr:unnamed protein product [Ambrosiozyma monospora]
MAKKKSAKSKSKNSKKTPSSASASKPASSDTHEQTKTNLKQDKQNQSNKNESSISSFSLNNWRNLYILFAIPLRFVFALQASYIHPDEFFQTFQPLYHDNEPWEFSNTDSPARSIVPLNIFYRPLIILATERLQLPPLTVYYIVKLGLCLMTWFVYDYCLFKIMPVKQERVKALFFATTSFLTMVHQAHSFSNAIESCLVVLAVWIIGDMRSHLELTSQEQKLLGHGFSLSKLILLGAVMAIGVFNRVTFPVWFILPGWYLLRFALRFPFRSLLLIITFVVASLVCIYVDTVHFKGSFPIPFPIPKTTEKFSALITTIQQFITNAKTNPETITTITSQLVITPLNNLIYNTNVTNLSQHGLHPHYTHLLINYPQILGPIIALLFPFTTKYIRTTPFLSLISGLLTLSLVPHQELRFLMPALPLSACCIDLDYTPSRVANCRVWKLYKAYIIQLWMIFNVGSIVFYGILHQGGVVSALAYLHEHVDPTSTHTHTHGHGHNDVTVPDNSVLLFWRTYKPPTWMLYVSMDHQGSRFNCSYFNKNEHDLSDFEISDVGFIENGSLSILLLLSMQC